ncbi:MAG: TIGR02530 family flagellar biosynthesis protein [Negativicutes bacterium]|nr:TIGR02530 family flagellar biosynthesis protein [Negativicutes bacterium]
MTDNRILFPQQPILPVNKPAASPASQQGKTTNPSAFSQVLSQQLTGLKFSQHALQRLQNRNIQFNTADLAKLSDAVDKAAQKGSQDSLILMNDTALVVSVKNRTVVTAMDGASMKDNVFTNIDSAVIV